MMNESTATLFLLGPELYVTALTLILLVSYLFTKKLRSPQLIRWAIFGLIPGFAFIVALWPVSEKLFYGSFQVNPFATLLKGVFLGAAISILSITAEFVKTLRKRAIDFVLLILIAILGTFFLASSGDLITLFITIEWLTISLYVLTAFLRSEERAVEAGTKYLIVGAFSAALFLYGISLIYGVAGGVGFEQVRAAVTNSNNNALLSIGFLLILSGIGFKISMFPFHLWAPDVYQGAPTPSTSFLAVVSKTAGFVALLKFLFVCFETTFLNWPLLIACLSALTLLYGNLGAIGQSNIKRLFAYSSIGHAGYLLMGLLSGTIKGIEAVLFYLIVYAATNLLAFFVITIANRELKSEEIKSYRGLAKKNQMLAGAFFVALLSLGGIPPLAGFFGKFLVIQSAISGGYLWLAILGAINVAVALFYYLTIIKEMYFTSGKLEGKETIQLEVPAQLLILTLVCFIILAGVFQAPLYYLIRTAAQNLA